ncbi:MAG: helix-turn-helix domain-containing protein [Saprospiraceae bacterium]
MGVTNADNQEVMFKERLKKIYRYNQAQLENGFCPTSKVLAPTLDSWGIFCLFHLAYDGTLRFGELRKKIDGISPRMLTVTLKRLEENGFVHRKAFSEIPPRVEYSLTDFGLELSQRLSDLTEWFLDRFEERKER